MNLSALINKESTGILQRLRPLEDRIFEETYARMKSWKTGKNVKAEVLKYYRWLDEYVLPEYEKCAGL
jgi:hypothetical protein